LQKLVETLAKLSQLHGPSGYEDDVRKFILQESSKHADEIETDAIGNFYVKIRGRSDGPTVIVAAHMDEVGFMVKHIEQAGFLRFEPVGTIDPRILPAKRVVVKGSSSYPGTIGTRPPHIITDEEANRPTPLSDLYIDVGAASDKEAMDLGIEVGSIVTFDEPFRELCNGRRVMGKAFDDRAGCTVSLALIEALAKEGARANIVFAFTVQEELGLRGAEVAANHVRPDVGIVFETTVAADVPDMKQRQWITAIDSGPTIRVMDSSMMAQRPMLDYIKKMAEKSGIPHQMQLSRTGGTDAGKIHLYGSGVPTGLISTPCRYLHGPSSVLSTVDLENVVRLAEATVRGIESKQQFMYSSGA